MTTDGTPSNFEKYSSQLPPIDGVDDSQAVQPSILPVFPGPVESTGEWGQPAPRQQGAPPATELNELKKDLFFIAWAKGAVRVGKKAVARTADKLKEPIIEKTEEAGETLETWKQYIKTFGLPATIIAAVVVGFVAWRAKEGDINSNLGEDIKGFIENLGKRLTGQRVIDEQDLPPDIVKERDQERYLGNYVSEGMNGANVRISPVTEIGHFAQTDKMTELVAAAGGPNWMLPVVKGEDGNFHPVGTADMLAGQLAGQLNNVTKQEILDNWMKWNNDQLDFLNFLSSHGANQQVVNNYQCAINVAKSDTSPDTWTDRLDDTRACLIQGQGNLTPINTNNEVNARRVTKVEQQKFPNEPRADFYNIGTEAIRMAGGDPAEGLGFLETAAATPFNLDNTVEMKGQDLTEIYLPKTGQLENGPLSLVMAGLFLVRFGPNLPKKLIADLNEGIENIYFWFKLGQGSKMMRDLVILGKNGLRAFSKKETSVTSRQ